MTTEKPEETTAVAKSQPRSIRELEHLQGERMDLATAFAASGMFKDVKSQAQALVKIQTGHELDIPPMAAMMGVYFIETKSGPPTIMVGYKIQAALVKRHPDYDYEVIESTAEQCRIGFTKRGKALGESVFTMKDAQSAGLVRDGGNWKKWPRKMLFARAITHGVSHFCPDVLMGAGFDVEPQRPEEERLQGADIIEGEVVPDGAPTEIHWGPEGPPPNPWAEFWAHAKDVLPSMTNDKLHAYVHEMYGVGPEKGALKEQVEDFAKTTDQTVAAVLRKEIEGFEKRAYEWRKKKTDAEFGGEAAEAEPIEAAEDDEPVQGELVKGDA